MCETNVYSSVDGLKGRIKIKMRILISDKASVDNTESKVVICMLQLHIGKELPEESRIINS